MALHRLTSITIGVPDVDATAAYYEEFGLVRCVDGSFSTVDGGQQLRIQHENRRRLLSLGVGVDDPDDIARIARSLAHIDVAASLRPDGTGLTSREPVAGFTVDVSVAPRYDHRPAVQEAYNLPGRDERPNRRAPGILRRDRCAPGSWGTSSSARPTGR